MRDVDEEIAREQLALGCIRADELQVFTAALDARQRHAPLDPASQRALLVEQEIMRGLGSQ